MKRILNFGVLFLFFSLLALGTYLFITSKKAVKEEQKESPKDIVQIDQNQTLNWRIYENEKYSYTLKYPPLLYKREFENQGGYLHFVRFEENKFSLDKGLAFGVSDGSLENEVKRIKQEFSQGAKLVNEAEVDIGDIKGIRLDYEPEVRGGEKRAVVIFNGRGYSYSLSSVPEQIEKILAGFRFLN